jgi:hypothetical protein
MAVVIALEGMMAWMFQNCWPFIMEKITGKRIALTSPEPTAKVDAWEK